MWVFLALGAAALTSFNPILYKQMLRDADTIIVVWAVTLLSLPLLGLLTFGSDLHLPAFDGLFAVGVIGSAVLNVFAQLASTRALKLADVSLVTPLLIFSPVFTILISFVFLDEIPSMQGLVGVGLVLAGAYWLNRDPKADRPLHLKRKRLAFTPAVLFVLLAGLLWAITPLLEKVAILHTKPEDPRFTAFIATALLTLMLTPPALARGKSALTKLLAHRRELIFAGLIAGTAPVLGYTAYSLVLVGYVTTLFKLSTLLTVIWSLLFLKERGLAQRLPGSALMVVGAILIST